MFDKWLDRFCEKRGFRSEVFRAVWWAFLMGAVCGGWLVLVFQGFRF